MPIAASLRSSSPTMRDSPMNSRPRNIANDILDAVETATSKWTRQKKSEERHPGMVRYRASRMTREPRTTQKDAAWQVMKEAYLTASGPRQLPAKARQIYYQARPKIMALTEDKELAYGYFSQTLLPDYIEEHGATCAAWNVVYDARGHFEEPHTNRNIGCGTLEVDNYLRAMKEPGIAPAEFADASVEIIGPAGGFSAILYIEKEGFNPLFKAVNLANRYDLMIISNKGLSVTAARKLIDEIYGGFALPLFVLHDFDADGFKIFGTLQRDTRRYQFCNAVETIDLGLRLADITDLEREPAAATKTRTSLLRAQLTKNGATNAEIDILLSERVELNAMTSDALIEMIERKLKAYGLKKIIPDDKLLGEAYRTFHRSNELREKFEQMESKFKASKIKVPKNLKTRVQAILKKHPDLRWDDALKIVLDATQLDAVRAEKQKAKKKSGDFTDDENEE
jgi:Topoisomerase 6 subunit A/Spo11, Toprim domain